MCREREFSGLLVCSVGVREVMKGRVDSSTPGAGMVLWCVFCAVCGVDRAGADGRQLEALVTNFAV